MDTQRPRDAITLDTLFAMLLGLEEVISKLVGSNPLKEKGRRRIRIIPPQCVREAMDAGM
jgi:hypothetical protein